MHERILIAGSGGQGIVLLGRLLARLGLQLAPHVTFFPSYGAEVRGGTSNCQVILASQEIASPVAEAFDSLLIMNQQSADRFLPNLAPRGLALLNTSLCRRPRQPRVGGLPATEIADRLGSVRAANFVMLGAWLAQKKLAAPEQVADLVRAHFAGAKPEVLDLNLRALQAGMRHV